MAETKIIRIDTKDAKQQIKGLTNDVKNLDKAVDDISKVKISTDIEDTFHNAANEANNLNNKVRDLNADLANTSITIDQIAPNIAKMGAGVAGGFNIVSGAISMFGNNSEEATKALSQLQFYLQNIPLQFFAIAEGINATSSILGPLSDKFGNLFSNININSKKAFEGLSERIDSINRLIKIAKVRVSTYQKDVLDELGTIALIKDKLGKAFGSDNEWFGRLEGFFSGHSQEEYEELNNIFVNIFKDMEVQVRGTDNELAKLVSDFKALGKEGQANVLRLTGEIPILVKQMESLNAAQLKYDETKAKLAEAQEEIQKLKDEYQDFGKAIKNVLKFALNPANLGIVAITASLIAMAVAVGKGVKEMIKLNQQSKEVWRWTNEMTGITATGLKNAADEVVTIQTLVRNMKDENNSLKNKKYALEELNKIIPDYNGKMDDSGNVIKENTIALQDYIDELERQAKATAAVEKITEKYKTIIEKSIELENAKSVKAQVDAALDLYEDYYERKRNIAGGAGSISAPDWELQQIQEQTKSVLTATNRAIVASIPDIEKTIQQATDDIEYIYTNFDTNIRAAEKETVGAIDKIVIDWEKDNPLLDIDKLLIPGIKKLEEITDPIKEIYNPSGKILPYITKVFQMAQYQLGVLSDTMDRFGESSLGLTGSYSNVVDDFAKTFERMTYIITEKGEVSWERWKEVASLGIQSVGTLLNTLGDEQDTTTREGFESQKNYQVSATVMNMLAGILNAWSSAMTIPPPAGPILGAANSALIASLGAVQIAKIKAQQFDGDTSSSAINSVVIPPVNYSNLVQGASTESTIRTSKSYVSVVEINNKQNTVRVSEEEAKY